VRKLVASLLLCCLALPFAPANVGAAAPPFPGTIDLPTGFFPEGIAIGRGTTFYVGSLADGTIYRGDLRTGTGEVITGPVGPFSTVGIEVDAFNRVWVAGGITGTGRVYDGTTGALLASYTFTAPFESFVNDVVVTRTAAYFTDSGTANDPDPAANRPAGEPRLFVVPLGAGKNLPPQSAVRTLATNLPDIDFPNLNGIETTPDGRHLVVGHTTGGMLFRVDPHTGQGNPIDIGTPLPANDGIVRRGTTYYVVQNALAQVSAVRLHPRAEQGMVTRVYPVPGAETPTTAALFGASLYTVDARFGSGTGPYRVYRIALR
jgi:sugar lactone lactonase YvrE